jgi:putative ABC transport system substrate-binding protein
MRLCAFTLALVVATLPFGAQAQQAGRVYRIGLLIPVSAEGAKSNLDAFRQALRDLGYVEGRNAAFEYRYAQGRDAVFPSLAADLVGLNVDVIVTWGVQAARTSKQATTTIPIVMAAIADPVATGIVSSLARPGGNVTGVTSVSLELEAKRLELLRELNPRASRIGTFWNPLNPLSALILGQTQAAARAMGLELIAVEARITDEFAQAFATMTKARPDALTVPTEVVLLDRRARILEFVARSRLPAVYGYREYVDAGGLMFYGPSWPNLFRRAASYVDKILKGAKPADLPIEQPTKFELVINVKTARALGLTIPPSLLLRVDHIIE